MAFELFKHKRGRAAYAFPTVTLQASGGIGLNELAHEQLGNPSHIVLYYDRDAERIGLEGTHKDNEYGFPLRASGSGAYSVSIRSFFIYYDIPQDETRRYKAERSNDMLVIDLTAPIASIKRRSKVQHAREGEQSERSLRRESARSEGLDKKRGPML